LLLVLVSFFRLPALPPHPVRSTKENYSKARLTPTTPTSFYAPVQPCPLMGDKVSSAYATSGKNIPWTTPSLRHRLLPTPPPSRHPDLKRHGGAGIPRPLRFPSFQLYAPVSNPPRQTIFLPDLSRHVIFGCPLFRLYNFPSAHISPTPRSLYFNTHPGFRPRYSWPSKPFLSLTFSLHVSPPSDPPTILTSLHLIFFSSYTNFQTCNANYPCQALSGPKVRS